MGIPEGSLSPVRYTVIVAGGLGRRLGGVPKQFRLLSKKPLLMHTLEACYAAVPQSRIVLCLPRAHLGHWKELCEVYGCGIAHRCVMGGETRSDSVRNGLAVIEARDALVAIHDGARPFLPAGVLGEAFRVAGAESSAIPVIPLSDSLRRLETDGSSCAGARNEYRLVQTPQAFRLEILREAFAQSPDRHFDDEAARMDGIGLRVHLIKGAKENFKITTAFDWKLAEALLKVKERESASA